MGCLLNGETLRFPDVTGFLRAPWLFLVWPGTYKRPSPSVVFHQLGHGRAMPALLTWRHYFTDHFVRDKQVTDTHGQWDGGPRGRASQALSPGLTNLSAAWMASVMQWNRLSFSKLGASVSLCQFQWKGSWIQWALVSGVRLEGRH